MASISKEVITKAAPEKAWDALRDIGALHTRLVPGFVVNTELIPGGRKVTFFNNVTITETVVDLNDNTRRLAWTTNGSALGLTHYNSSARVFAREAGGSRIIWTSDLLPDTAAAAVSEMMERGAQAMAKALDQIS